jgi:hypothetical protein
MLRVLFVALYSCTALNLMEGEARDVTQYAEGIGCARRVDDNKDLFLAFAWVLPESRRAPSVLLVSIVMVRTQQTKRAVRLLL